MEHRSLLGLSYATALFSLLAGLPGLEARLRERNCLLHAVPPAGGAAVAAAASMMAVATVAAAAVAAAVVACSNCDNSSCGKCGR